MQLTIGEEEQAFRGRLRAWRYLFKEQLKAKIAVDRLLEVVRRRASGGNPVDRSLRDETVKAYVRVEILRLLNLDTMTRLSRGEEPGASSSLKKEFWTRLVQHLHETILAVEGPHGQLVSGDPRAAGSKRFSTAARRASRAAPRKCSERRRAAPARAAEGFVSYLERSL